MKKTKVDRTNEKIAKEEAKRDALILKRDEIQASIDACEENINKLYKQLDYNKLELIGKRAASNGLSIDDLLAAISNGDFYSVQDKLENHSKSKKNSKTKIDEPVEEEDEEDEEDDEENDEDIDSDSESEPEAEAESSEEGQDGDDEISPDYY